MRVFLYPKHAGSKSSMFHIGMHRISGLFSCKVSVRIPYMESWISGWISGPSWRHCTSTNQPPGTSAILMWPQQTLADLIWHHVTSCNQCCGAAWSQQFWGSSGAGADFLVGRRWEPLFMASSAPAGSFRKAKNKSLALVICKHEVSSIYKDNMI